MLRIPHEQRRMRGRRDDGASARAPREALDRPAALAVQLDARREWPREIDQRNPAAAPDRRHRAAPIDPQAPSALEIHVNAKHALHLVVLAIAVLCAAAAVASSRAISCRTLSNMRSLSRCCITCTEITTPIEATAVVRRIKAGRVDII